MCEYFEAGVYCLHNYVKVLHISANANWKMLISKIRYDILNKIFILYCFIYTSYQHLLNLIVL